MRVDPERVAEGALPRRIHLVGVGGAGLSGAARILARSGHVLSGFDRAPSEFIEELVRLGVPVHVGDDGRSALAEDVELVVRSVAVLLDDPDVASALERGIPVLKYAELLGRMAPAERTLAVAGTHGKTTVSWLLAYALGALEDALGEAAPTTGYLIGGLDRRTRTNAVAPGPGGWFAVEACEYDRSFLQLSPTAAVVTNVDADHLDYYGTMEAIELAFARFVDRIHPEGLLVVGDEVPERVTASCRAPVWRLGREFEVELFGEQRGRFEFRVIGPGWATPKLSLSLPGRFQVDNAALAIALVVGHAAREWHLEPALVVPEIARALHGFQGVSRRFDSWGTEGGVEVIHDYAHHPTEVRVTLEAARRFLPGKELHVLFQPHQYSRTARFLPEFVDSLRGTDRVVVADVYGARAHIDEIGAGPEELVASLKRAGVDAAVGGDLGMSIERTVKGITAESALLVLGAGDVETIRDDLLHQLAVRGARASSALR